MKEKLTHFVVAAVFLLILILIKINVLIPNEVGRHIARSGTDIILTCQTNFLIDAYNNSSLILSNVSDNSDNNKIKIKTKNQIQCTNATDVNSYSNFIQHFYDCLRVFISHLINTAITCYDYSIYYIYKNSLNSPDNRRSSSTTSSSSTSCCWSIRTARLFCKTFAKRFHPADAYYYCQLNTKRILILKRFPSEVLNFMIAITFVKLIIVVIAYQQLLHNGYIIIQNFYHKHIRQSDILVCNRPYQLKSGHGLDDEENPLHQQQQLSTFVSHESETISINSTSAQKLSESNQQQPQQSTIEQQEDTTLQQKSVKYSAVTRSVIDQKNNQLYHQQQQVHSNYCYQPASRTIDRYNLNYRNNRFYYHRCYCQKDHSVYQLEGKQSLDLRQYVKAEMMHNKSKSLSSRQQTTQFSISSSVQAASYDNDCDCTTESVESKVRYYNQSQLQLHSQSQSQSQTSVSRKCRKKKDTDPENVTEMLWQRSCAYSWCCDGFCNIFYRYREYIHIHCYKSCSCNVLSHVCCSYCFCEIKPCNSEQQTTTTTTTTVEKLKTKPASLHKANMKSNSSSNSNHNSSSSSNSNHKLNIIDISTKNLSSSSNIRQRSNRKCSNDSDADGNENDNDADSDTENGNNLSLRSLNAVKAITSVVQNRNYKRKLKKNLVWLFIGLVWLEGPKLINCSISHNNNDVTSISGNETTNKLGNSQGNNSESNSGNSNSGGGGSDGARNSSRNNSGNSGNINSPGPTGPRTGASEGNKDNLKDDHFYKIPTNSLVNSATPVIAADSVDNLNKYSFMQNTIAIEEALQVDKQYQRQLFNHQQDRIQPRKVSMLSSQHKGMHSNRQTERLTPAPSIFFESEEANRAQSDLVRLESIKRQILTKLGLTEKPNVTHPLPKQFIWDTIYRADGIRSVSDFDFNDDHRTQEHMRLSATVLEPPPLLPHHYQPIVKIINDMDELHTNQQQPHANHSADNDVSMGWRLHNLTSQQISDHKRQMLPKYQRKHQRPQQQRQKLENHKLKSQSQTLNQGQESQSQGQSQGKPSYTEPDYFEGDDFFGSTQEIITFAEKGKIYKKHRLVEFSPPSNKIPKQKLQIRNAEIHIRIEKIASRPSNTAKVEQSRHHHRQKAKEPNLKIWIFQLIGNDFSSKGFDQVATLCTSLTVDHNVLGWQKLDITETVQYWYSKHQKEKLRLLIDCTGCGSRYILHLFDRKYHHSYLKPSPMSFRQSPQKPRDATQAINKTSSATFNSNKPGKGQSQRYYYHYWQYNHHRYRRKNRVTPAQPNLSEAALHHHHHQQQPEEQRPINKDTINQLHMWPSSRRNRKSRDTNNEDTLEGISYEVGAEYHLEDRLNPNRPFLVLHTEPTRSRRVRRRAVDCSGAVHGQCCKESFYVSFKALGWDDWIIAPRGYFANYCRGDCTGPYRTPDTFQTFHAHFIEEYRKMGLLNGMQPCCAPVKFSSMSLIYYGDDGIIKRDLPKMVVDECGCP